MFWHEVGVFAQAVLTCLGNFERFIPGKRLGVEGCVGIDGAA